MRICLLFFASALIAAATAVGSQTLPILTAEDIGTLMEGSLAERVSSPMYVDVSPDGQWFVYTDRIGLCIVPVDGGEERLLFYNDQFSEMYKDNPLYFSPPGGGIVNHVSHPTFTPDSKEITFAVAMWDSAMGSSWGFHEMKSGQFYIDRASNPVPHLKSVDIETGEVSDIALGCNPDWDPTGRFLIYGSFAYSEDSGQEIIPMLLDTAPGESRQLNLDYDPWGPDAVEFPWMITPDGQHILFSKQSEETVLTWDGNPVQPDQVFRYALASGETEQVSHLNNSTAIRFRVISPDGKWLFFTSYIISHPNTATSGNILDLPSELDVLDMETGKCYVLVPPTHNLDVFPVCISTDGSTLYALVHHKTISQDEEMISIDFDPETLNPTAVETVIPVSFPTLTSYPNPFNASTTITFTLPVSGFTELAVYNLAGQKIRTLVAGELTSGIHEVVWDGCDDMGNQVSSGIFVSRLVAGDVVVTNRMTLVK